MRIALIASGRDYTGYAIAIGKRLVELDKRVELVYIVPRGDEWSKKHIKSRGIKAYIIEAAKSPNTSLSLTRSSSIE